MENYVRLRAISRSSDTVRFQFQAGRDLERLLWSARELALSCSDGVPDNPTVLRTAFLLTMAPLRWMYGATIELDGPITRAAVEPLESTSAYLSRYYGWPLRPLTDGQASEPVADERAERGERALMFSGGVDSMMTLAEHGPQIGLLVHTSNFENLDGRISPAQRAEALRQTRAVASARAKRWMHLHTNVPEVFNHRQFDENFPNECSFWLGLEHVHHLMSALTVAPVRFSEVLLSGGMNDRMLRAGSCCGNADFAGTYRWPHPVRLTHELLLRQKKVEYLLDHAPQLLHDLRVCYSSGSGTCPECRKCQATFLMVLSAGGRFVQTNFPPAILPAVEARAREVSGLPPEEHYFFNEALTGRALSGSTPERWAQLLALIARERAEAGATGLDGGFVQQFG